MSTKKSPIERAIKTVKRLSKMPLMEPKHRKDGLIMHSKKRKKAKRS